jgi:hypothetical protein
MCQIGWILSLRGNDGKIVFCVTSVKHQDNCAGFYLMSTHNHAVISGALRMVSSHSFREKKLTHHLVVNGRHLGVPYRLSEVEHFGAHVAHELVNADPGFFHFL